MYANFALFHSTNNFLQEDEHNQNTVILYKWITLTLNTFNYALHLEVQIDFSFLQNFTTKVVLKNLQQQTQILSQFSKIWK